MKNSRKIRTLAGFFALVGVTLVLAISCMSATNKTAVNGKTALSLWNDSAQAKSALISYIEAITKPGSADFIPEENRIAVFDFDGTLFCETDPNYFDHMLAKYRVLSDANYKDMATGFEKEIATGIVEKDETKINIVDHGKIVASSYKGFTPSEFYDYIAEFKKQPMPSYDGMKMGDGFYKPMLQIVNYLQASGFTVYIVTGTDRFIIRGLLQKSPLDLPPCQIIGSDENLVATNQGETDGLDYTFKRGDKVVMGGDFLIKNLKMNKVTAIVREIGVQPVLSFGNSSGDSAMANYVINDNRYKALAFMLCCDDTECENGNLKSADKMKKLCAENNWIPVSMKNDWKTIYGEGVTKK